MLLTWDDHQQLQNCRLTWPIFFQSVNMLCKSSFLCLGKAQFSLVASHLLACRAFWQLLEYPTQECCPNLLERPVSLQALTKSCQLQQCHEGIPSILIFPLLWSALHFSGTLLDMEYSHLENMCKDPPWYSSQAVMMPVHLGIVMMFSGTLTCVFLMKIMICQHS